MDGKKPAAFTEGQRVWATIDMVKGGYKREILVYRVKEYGDVMTY